MVRCAVKSILKLMRANIRSGKGAFKSIILLMMLLTFSFSGTVSNDDRLREARTERFAEVGVPDLLVWVYGDLLTDGMLNEVRGDPNVRELHTKQSLLFVHAPLVGGRESDVRLSLNAYEPGIRVFDDAFADYAADNTLSDGEIYLPSKMRLNDGFQKGAKITLQTNGGYDTSFTVKGFYEDIVSGAVTFSGYNCIVTQHDFERLAAEKTDSFFGSERSVLSLSLLYINGTGALSQTELRRELAKNTALISTANSAFTRDMLSDSVEMFSEVGTRIIAIFVALLLTVVLIMMFNSIRASIEMDQAELGILKSQGFTAGQISLVYVLQYTLALMIGAVLGIAVSVPACRYLISMWKILTGIRSETGVSVLKCAVLSVCIILICAAFIFAATAKIRRISPVSAIAGAKGDVYFDSRLNVRIRKKPLAFFIALRQLNSRRKSYLGTAFIVLLLTFFIISIMILTKGLDGDQLFTDITGEISMSDTSGFRLSDADEAEAAIRQIDSGADLLTESYHRMLVDGELFAVHAYRSPEDVFKPLKGRAPLYDNEIMLTEAVSEELHKQIGDSVTVSYQGHAQEFIVTGNFQSAWEYGLVTLVTTGGMQQLGNNEIEGAFVKVSDTAKQQQIIDMLNAQYAGRLKAEAFAESGYITNIKKITNILMNAISYAIYAVLLTFAAAIVAAACKRAFIRERTDIGIFKATGFTVGGLRLQFALRFALIALIGSAAGCTAGMLWSRGMLTGILQVVGLTDFTTDYTAAMFIVPSAILCLCFFLTAWLASRRIAQVNVRELVTE